MEIAIAATIIIPLILRKRGYVNLGLGNHRQTGDDKDMVRSGTAFLQHGYYQPLCDMLTNICKQKQPLMLIDAGCGGDSIRTR